MTDRPAQPPPQSPPPQSPAADSITSEQLERRFGDRWEITLESLGVWSATRRSGDGRHIRCIVARSPGELVVKLWAAEQGPNSPRSEGTYPTLGEDPC
jgi:hypothetical protein